MDIPKPNDMRQISQANDHRTKMTKIAQKIGRLGLPNTKKFVPVTLLGKDDSKKSEFKLYVANPDAVNRLTLSSRMRSFIHEVYIPNTIGDTGLTHPRALSPDRQIQFRHAMNFINTGAYDERKNDQISATVYENPDISGEDTDITGDIEKQLQMLEEKIKDSDHESKEQLEDELRILKDLFEYKAASGGGDGGGRRRAALAVPILVAAAATVAAALVPR